VAYPFRPTLQVLPQFRGTAGTRQTAAQRAALLDFVTAGYLDGQSIRQLAELTGRTQTAIRRALDQAAVPRRPRGAQRLASGGQRSNSESCQRLIARTPADHTPVVNP